MVCPYLRNYYVKGSKLCVQDVQEPLIVALCGIIVVPEAERIGQCKKKMYVVGI